MSDDAAAEAAERKRVMEAVAHMLDAALDDYLAERITGMGLRRYVWAAITELRTPVGRGRTE